MKELSQLELKVITDDLTGLYNRRYLNDKLREETRRSLSQKASFGLIMLDLDHFKEVNDSYGHKEGDEALIWISNILKDSVREGDIVIRFAGDEFFLILPGAGVLEAKQISKRIYQNIANNPFRGSKAQISIPVGVSGGIAIYPEDAESEDELIKSADSGLYLAKEHGRGKVCLASEAKKLKTKKIDRSQLLHPPFIGRTDILKNLTTNVKNLSVNSENIIFLMQGEPGIGKTRLIDEFLQNISHDFLILKSVCFPHEYEIPYQPIISLFKHYINQDKELFKSLFSKLSGKEQNSLIKLIPNIEIDIEIKSSNSILKDEIIDNSNLYFTITSIIQNTAHSKPLIIVIEDLQWIDLATLDILSHIISQTSSLPIFFIFSLQTLSEHEVKNINIFKFIRRVRRQNKFEEILLNPLSKEEVKKLVRKIFNSDNPQELLSIENLICNEAEGNPLFIKELLLKAVEEKILIYSGKSWSIDNTKVLETPNRIKDIVTGKIESMNENLKHVLEKASVIGKEFIFEILKQIAEINEGHLLDILDKALSQAFLIENTSSKDDSFMFSSLQLQKALYDNLSSIRKRMMHQKVMEIIEKSFHSERENFVEMLFFHAQKAKVISKTFLYGMESGIKAYNNYGLIEAKSFFAVTVKAYQSLENEYKEMYEKQYFETLLCYAETLKFLGEYQKATEVILLMPKIPTTIELLASVHLKNGNYNEAVILYNKAYDETDDLKLKCKIKSGLAELYFRQGKYSLAEENAKTAYQLALEISNSNFEALALKTLGSVCFYENNFNKALDFYRRSLKLYKNLEERSGIAGVLNNIGTIHYKNKKYKIAEKCFLKAKEICDETGFHSLSLLLLNNLGNVYLDTSQIGWAEEYFSEALTLSEDSQDVSTAIACYINLGNIFHIKDPLKSESYNLKGLELCKKIGEQSKESYFYHALADLAKMNKQYKEAENWYEKAINLREKLNEADSQLFSRIKLIELYETQNDEKNILKKIHDIDIFLKANMSKINDLSLVKEFYQLKTKYSS